MKNKNKMALIFISWVLIIMILYKTGILTTDMDRLKNLIEGNPLKVQLIFVFLSTMRVVFFIPQTIFILLGSAIFGPYTGFLLSFISLIIAQSIIYIIGRYFNKQLFGSDFQHKHSNIIDTIKTYGYKILALGIICPIAPSDLITASAACIKLSYKKCITIIALVDAPMIFLYGFLGTGLEDSAFFKVLTLLIIVFISYYSFLIWNKVTKIA